MIVIEWIAVAVLFVVGIWLSAFFSGSETAYYRLSVLRVNVEAQSGDKRARRMLWFVRHPAEFVATVLIGNNVANYVTTLSIGLGLALLTSEPTDVTEILMTLAVAPVIFLLGELVPKHVNYMTPMRSLASKIALFRVVFWLVRPLSIPLVWITKFFEHLAGQQSKSAAAFLGKPQIGDLLTHGRVEGVLTERQAELTNRLLLAGASPVALQVRSLSFEFGLRESATRDEAIAYAHQFGLTYLLLHEDDNTTAWTSSVRTSDLFESDAPLKALAKPLTTLSPEVSRLDAIQQIRDSGGGYALVVDGKQTPIGLVSLQALVRPLFQDAPAIAIAESQALRATL